MSASETPAPPSSQQPAHNIRFIEAFWFWLKLGFISFGGPAGQIAVMHQELVEKRRWLSERRFLHGLNYCMMLPGPEAQQHATYIGWLLHGRWGGLAAGVLFVLPSLLILIALSWLYFRYGDVPLVAGLFYGIKPAITAIVVHACWRIGSRALRHGWHVAIAAAAFVALFALDTPFPLVVLGAALLGLVGGRLAPAQFRSDSKAGSNKSYGPAVLDDDTPLPAHAQFRWSRLALTLLSCLLLWALPLALLSYLYGWQGTFTQMAWFFTKAALLTFGGAYAVLPYVYQGAVEQFRWLSGPQMIDGLALGETTPGPLIMVVAFVGFVGGAQTAALGAGNEMLAGVVAACIVTYFTFLPSFLFIFAGAPFIESTKDDVKLTAPLTAITAAVVGVILNLALFFAYHVLWPQGFNGRFDWPSAIISVLALLALFRLKWNVMLVIGGAAVLGLVVHSLR
ncbi:MAG: chromate efflux transporter [Pseudomonadota bacterium]